MLIFSLVICGLITIISLVGILCLLLYAYSKKHQKRIKYLIANKHPLPIVGIENRPTRIICETVVKDKYNVYNDIGAEPSVLQWVDYQLLYLSQKSSKSHIDKNINMIISQNKMDRMKFNRKNDFVFSPLDYGIEHGLREDIIYGNN